MPGWVVAVMWRVGCSVGNWLSSSTSLEVIPGAGSGCGAGRDAG